MAKYYRKRRPKMTKRRRVFKRRKSYVPFKNRIRYDGKVKAKISAFADIVSPNVEPQTTQIRFFWGKD